MKKLFPALLSLAILGLGSAASAEPLPEPTGSCKPHQITVIEQDGRVRCLPIKSPNCSGTADGCTSPTACSGAYCPSYMEELVEMVKNLLGL